MISFNGLQISCFFCTGNFERIEHVDDKFIEIVEISNPCCDLRTTFRTIERESEVWSTVVLISVIMVGYVA